MPWIWWVVIGADALFVVALAWLLLKAGGGGAANGAAPPDLSKFIEESQQICQEFDRLLNEKRDLVHSTLTAIDSRLAELSAMEKRLSEIKPPPVPEPRVVRAEDPADSVREFREKVRRMAKDGKAPADIAEATGRPRGEVELVLGLTEGGA